MRQLILCVAALGLTGCVSLAGPKSAPVCDGYSRRPLNRSMWDWDRTQPVARPAPVAAPAEPSEPAPLMRKGEAGVTGYTDATFDRTDRAAAFDVAASLQPCAEEHGRG